MKYKFWVIKDTVLRRWPEKVLLKFVWMIPPKIALWCFVRVVSLRGDCPDWYKETYDAFKLKHSINGM